MGTIMLTNQDNKEFEVNHQKNEIPLKLSNRYMKIHPLENYIRYFVFIFAALLIINGSTLARPTMEITDMQKIIQKDENEIDLTTVSLSISANLNPDLNVSYYEGYISKIVTTIKEQIQKETDSKKKIGIFTSILHNTYGFAVPDEPAELAGPEYGMIDFVLKEKRGNCLGLVSLYLMIAEKLKLPIKAQTVHSHIFLVYDDGTTKFYIESTTLGTIHNNLDYLKLHGKGLSLEKVGGRDLRPFGKKELIADIFYNSGLILSKRGYTDKSIEAYKMALRFNDNHDDAYRAWGDVLNQKEDYQNAIDKFKKATSINPNNDASYTNMGIALNHLERFKEAITKFEAASQVNPNNAYTYLNWGIALICVGEYDRAKIKLNRAKSLDHSLAPNVERLMKLMK